jgi:selenium-binding protein 1
MTSSFTFRALERRVLQYDVSDPFKPKKTGSVRIGGIANRAAHPKKPDQPLAGGPQMVEVSRDGKRIYFHQLALCRMGRAILSRRRRQLDGQADADPNGGITFDENFFLESNDYRVHQVRLEGGDSSSDSFCFP